MAKNDRSTAKRKDGRTEGKYIEERVTAESHVTGVTSGYTLNDGELKKLEEAASSAGVRLELSVILALYAGLRLGEICSLKWREVDLETGIITVLSEIGFPLRVAPLTPKAADKLREYALCSRGDCFVITGDSEPASARVLRYRLKQLACKTGLELSFSGLRNTYRNNNRLIHANALVEHKKKLVSRLWLQVEAESQGH